MFVIEVPYFNLDHIYNSGQAPRWIKLKEGKYVIPFKDKALKIEQQRDKYDWTRYRFIMSCSEEDFYNIWFHYFDLKMDCMDENMKIKNLGGKFKVPANLGFGIHILNQDKFETYVLSKLITYVGYTKAKAAINHIAEACGIKHIQSMREAGKIVWYEFPTPEMILENFNKLRKMGKVNAWLKKLCEAIVYDFYAYEKSGNWNDLCKLLMGDKSVFPLTSIEDILEEEFDCVPEEFADWYLNEIENKGLVYMYIVNYALNKPWEVASGGIGR